MTSTVVMHVPFGQARQPHEQGIVLSQKRQSLGERYSSC